MIILIKLNRGSGDVIVLFKHEVFGGKVGEVLITMSEVLRRLEVNKSYLYELLDKGIITSCLTEDGLKITLSSLENFENRREADSRELAHYFATQATLLEGEQ